MLMVQHTRGSGQGEAVTVVARVAVMAVCIVQSVLMVLAKKADMNDLN